MLIFFGISFVFWGYAQWQQKQNIFSQLQNLREKVFLEQVDVLADYDLNYFLEEDIKLSENIANKKVESFVEWAWIEKNREDLKSIQVVSVALKEEDECWTCRFEVRNLEAKNLQKGIVDVFVWYENPDGTLTTGTTIPLSKDLLSGKRYSFQNFAHYELQGKKRIKEKVVRARLVFKDLKGKQLVVDPFLKIAMT
ncbi:MAG: hypothetical protein AB8C84_05565 [Oligoflexales bacterium]